MQEEVPAVANCSTCGQPLVGGRCDRCTKRLLFRVVQRELILLILLAALTVPIFLFTRSIAARNRATNLKIAQRWNEQGQELIKSGRIPEAIDAFRNATTNNHDNANY